MSLPFIFWGASLHLCVSILTSVLFPKQIKCCLQLPPSLCISWAQIALCVRVCLYTTWEKRFSYLLPEFWCFLLHLKNSCNHHPVHRGPHTCWGVRTFSTRLYTFTEGDSLWSSQKNTSINFQALFPPQNILLFLNPSCSRHCGYK